MPKSYWLKFSFNIFINEWVIAKFWSVCCKSYYLSHIQCALRGQRIKLQFVVNEELLKIKEEKKIVKILKKIFVLVLCVVSLDLIMKIKDHKYFTDIKLGKQIFISFFKNIFGVHYRLSSLFCARDFFLQIQPLPKKPLSNATI